MSAAYYEGGGVTIYHGDCRDILPTLRAEALVTDPPYGVGLVRKTSDFRGSSSFDAGASLAASKLYDDDPAAIESLLGVAIPLALACTERAIIFSGTRMLWAYPRPAAIGAVFTPNGAGRSAWGFQCSHPILFYGRDPYTASGKGSRPNGFRTEQPNREHFDHPCPKPIAWMRWAIMRGSCDMADVILDPFAGSGTTLRAAMDLGHKAIGIEIEERYCEIAAKRLSQSVLAFGEGRPQEQAPSQEPLKFEPCDRGWIE